MPKAIDLPATWAAEDPRLRALVPDGASMVGEDWHAPFEYRGGSYHRYRVEVPFRDGLVEDVQRRSREIQAQWSTDARTGRLHGSSKAWQVDAARVESHHGLDVLRVMVQAKCSYVLAESSGRALARRQESLAPFVTLAEERDFRCVTSVALLYAEHRARGYLELFGVGKAAFTASELGKWLASSGFPEGAENH